MKNMRRPVYEKSDSSTGRVNQGPIQADVATLLLILAAVCLCFGAVGGKLAVIQIGEYAVWQERAMEQQMSNSIISPKRGIIYDTNMEVLAQTKEVATIIMAPSEIPDEATRTLIADELSVLLEINRARCTKKPGKPP